MKISYPFQFKRQYAKPLDSDKVFSTLKQMNDYLKAPARYPGQLATCLQTPGTVYVLDNSRDLWMPISAGVGGVPGEGGVAAEGSPVNPVDATVTIAAADLAIMAIGDVVEFNGNFFVKAEAADGTDWDDAAALAAAINTLADWAATESAGAITITAAAWGTAFNGRQFTMAVLEDETDGADGAGTTATATISAASLARMDDGDVVHFDRIDFVKAAEPAILTNEFADAAGLALVMNELTDWGAAESEGAVTLTAATDNVELNEMPVHIELYRETADGTNGTSGTAGQLRYDATHLYLCTETNTWRRIEHAALAE